MMAVMAWRFSFFIPAARIATARTPDWRSASMAASSPSTDSATLSSKK